MTDRSGPDKTLDVEADRTPPDAASPAAVGSEYPTVAGDAGHSVLESLANQLPGVPRVLLRESADDGEAPVVRTQSSEIPADPGEQRYQLHGEIARGGMGAIIKGRDVDLGRDLAFKVLLDLHRDKPEVVQRFVEEAQIGGQLQHPGIVPVYELGQFRDRRPFFTMKLVKGKTLSSLLADRETPNSDRPRFLGIFEQICQTIAYAHSRGVIHRDLKPANVMVGAFGEVQVMDWGLAKVLAEGGVADEKKAQDRQQEGSIIRTLRSTGGSDPGSVGSQTHMGSVMGTPAYMPPEQALGEVDHMDERADVFGLGAILCEILTGKPPYVGKDGNEIFRQAARGKLDDCYTRLNQCQVESELVDLAKQCLAAEADQRPRHAGVVAARVSGFLESVQTRLRAAEVERAAEAARAEEAHRTAVAAEATAKAERRARRLQLWLAAVVLTLTTAVGIGAVVAAVHFRRQEEIQRSLTRSEQTAKLQAEVAREAESQERRRAEAEKRRADITLTDMQASRGLLAAENGELGQAVLWFAEAAQQAAVAADAERRTDNWLRARNWGRHAVQPVAAVLLGTSEMAFQPGGGLLLLRQDQRLRIWDWREDAFLPWGDGLDDVSAACWSPDGAVLAIGCSTGDTQIRSVPDGTLLHQLKQPEAVTALAFSPDGTYLAIGSRTVLVWDMRRQELLPRSWTHPQEVHSLLFNRAGDRLVSACKDKMARVFAVGEDASDEPIFPPKPHDPHHASPPAFVDDDRGLITIAGRKQLMWWDAESGQPAGLATIATRSYWLSRVLASPDGARFAIAGDLGAEVWNCREPDAESLPLPHKNNVEDFVFSPDGEALLSVGWDDAARIRSVADGRDIHAPLPHMEIIGHCAWSDDNRHLATSQVDGLLRIWELPSRPDPEPAATGWGDLPRASFDGRLIAPGIWNEQPLGYGDLGVSRLTVLDAATGKPAGVAVTLPGGLVDSCVNADKRTVTAVSLDGTAGWLSVWEIATGRAVFQPLALPGPPISVAARPRSSHVAVLCTSGNLLVVDSGSGETARDIRIEGWQTTDERWPRVEYAPDGEILVVLTSTRNNQLHVLDAATCQPRYPPIRPVLEGGPCRGFAISADGRMIATAVNGRNAVQVWDLAGGRPLSQPLLHPGGFYGLFSVDFSPDGRLVLTGSKDGQARLWDWNQGTLACPPLHHENEVWCVRCLPDGRHALTAIKGGPIEVHLWELKTGKHVAATLRLSTASGNTPSSGAVLSRACGDTGKRVVAGLLTQKAAVFLDLNELLASPDMPPEQLSLLGQLMTCQQIKLGGTNQLSSDQWLQRWSRLREQRPAFGMQTLDELFAGRGRMLRRKLDPTRAEESLEFLRHALDELDRAAVDDVRRAELRANLLRRRAELLRQTDDRPAATSELNRARDVLTEVFNRQPDNEGVAGQLAEVIVQLHDWRWTVLTPTEMKSNAGATLKLQADRSMLVSGVNPDTESYQIVAPADLPKISAIRLEALPDASLPHGGSGRSPQHGAFHLAEFRIETVPSDPAAKPHPVAIDDAYADYETSGNPIGHVFDSRATTHWEVYPKHDQPHTAVFQFRDAVEPRAGGAVLRITLDSGISSWKQHALGRFRLSVTEESGCLLVEQLNQVSRQRTLPVLTMLSAAYYVDGDFEQAVDCLARSVAKRQRVGALELLLLALACEELNQPERARRSFDRAIQWLKENEADPLTRRLAREALRQFESRTRDEAEALLAGFDDARQLAALTEAIEANPDDAAAHRARGLWYACRGMWSQAAKDQIAVVELNPQNWYAWMPPAAALILAGEREEYRRLCIRMLAQFEDTTDPVVAEVVSKTNLLLADESDVTKLPLAVLADALDRGTFSESIKPWGFATRGFGAYRAGRCDEAVRWVGKARETRQYVHCEALALLILAMAQYRLDDLESARHSLAQAEMLIPAELDGLGAQQVAGRSPVADGVVHHDWLIAEILRREAAALIHRAPDRSPVSPPIEPSDH